MALAVPRTNTDLTPAWLSEALDRPVTAAVATTIAEGAGFMGRLARVELTYAAGASGPATVVAKMPTDEPGGVALAQMLRLWEREARFYLELAPDLPVRTPRCHYAGGDPDTGIYAIVMEDLSALVGGDQVAGASPQQAEAAIDWLARFHASESGGTRSESLAWLPSTSVEAADPMYQSLQPLLEAIWPAFVDEFGAFAPAEVLGWVERAVPRLTEAIGERLLTPTLVHSDFRVDNLFFDGDEVVTLDWQAVAFGQGLYDLAYFLGGSLPTEQRAATERALVERYRRGLATGGVEVPGPAEMFDLYRRTMLYALEIVALLMAQLDLTVNARAVDLARSIVQRFYTAGAQLRVGDFAVG